MHPRNPQALPSPSAHSTTQLRSHRPSAALMEGVQPPAWQRPVAANSISPPLRPRDQHAAASVCPAGGATLARRTVPCSTQSLGVTHLPPRLNTREGAASGTPAPQQKHTRTQTHAGCHNLLHPHSALRRLQPPPEGLPDTLTVPCGGCAPPSPYACPTPSQCLPASQSSRYHPKECATSRATAHHNWAAPMPVLSSHTHCIISSANDGSCPRPAPRRSRLT